MKLRKLSTLFTITGVIVGSVAAIGYGFDLVPSLPPAVLKLVIYKLTFIGALGLVVFGAVLGRVARTQEKLDAADGASGRLLGEPGPDGVVNTESRREREQAESW